MYESDNEDKIEENDSTVESVNNEIQERKVEELQRKIDTLEQMVQNRDQEINKPVQNVEAEKIAALSNLLGINKMKEQIDELNTGQNQIIGKLSELITGFNNMTASVAPHNPESTTGDPMQKMSMLGELVDKGIQLYSTYKQNKSPENTLPALDPSWIMSEAIQSVKDDFSLGKDLRTAIKNTLKQKTVNTIIKGVVSSNTDNDDPA